MARATGGKLARVASLVQGVGPVGQEADCQEGASGLRGLQPGADCSPGAMGSCTGVHAGDSPGHLKLSRPGHAASAEGRFEPRLLWERTFSRAAYRKVVGGTTCKACQRNFWAGTRLAVHLRDSPGCVAVLRTLGPPEQEFAHGLGSRGWRRPRRILFWPAAREQIGEAAEAVEAAEAAWADDSRRTML